MSAFDVCLAEVDQAMAQHERGVLTPEECKAKVYGALDAYFDDDRPEDDLDFLISYARLPFERWAEDPLGGDRSLTAEFDRRIRALLHYPVAHADLAERLDAIRAGLGHGDGTAVGDLRELCAAGWTSCPRIFMFRRNVIEVLEVAAELGVVDALVDAVSPVVPGHGQLGGADSFDGQPRRHAFDLLATMAARPGLPGDAARDALVDLAAFVETAPYALTRLPVHLLTPAHRSTLFGHLSSYEELLGGDPLFTSAHHVDRLPDALRSVLWLASDAAHIG